MAKDINKPSKNLIDHLYRGLPSDMEALRQAVKDGQDIFIASAFFDYLKWMKGTGAAEWDKAQVMFTRLSNIGVWNEIDAAPFQEAIDRIITKANVT